MSIDLQQLTLVYMAYAIAAGSPGPSNMAIMGVAMRQGRRAALMLAAGIVTGSMFWALLATTGVSAVLARYAEALIVLKILGGIYLLYLAARSARSAMARGPQGTSVADGDPRPTSASFYRRGLLLHLGNPKAVLAWIALVTLGFGPGAGWHTAAAIIGGCAVLSVSIFGGYALAFSTAPMIRAYGKARRWIEGALAVFFGAVGIRLLISRT